MFKSNFNSVVNVTSSPYLTKPIENEELLLNCQLTQFDREGYELLPIEQEYYKANNVTLHTEKVLAHESGNADEWQAFVKKWFEPTPTTASYLKLDHSFCVVRYAFDGEAREQILKHAKTRPELNKLLNIRPKYGADFCVDYVTDDDCFELVHWEWDFLYRKDLFAHIVNMEQAVEIAQWDNIIKAVRLLRQSSSYLDSEAEGNFKAALFGLPKAFRLYKTFA